MFTKKTLAGFAFFFHIHSFAKSGPFIWNSQARILTVTESKVHKLLQVLSFTWVLVNSSWAPINFVRGLVCGAPIVTSVLNFLFFQFYFLLLLYRCSYFKFGGAIKEFVNCMLNFNRKASVRLLSSEHPVKVDGCEVYTWLMIYCVAVNPVVGLASLYGRDPLNTRYLYHFVAPGPGKTWSFWFWAAIEYFGFLSFYCPWILVLILVWAYSKSTTFWLRQIRFGANARVAKQPQDIIRLFQQLEILNILFNASFASLATPVLILQIMIMHVVGIYINVRFHNSFALPIYGVFAFWSVAWFVVEGLLYTMLGNLNYYSRRVIKSWKNGVGSQNRKRLNAMRPLGISVGSIYVIHRTTVMYIFLSVANFTVQTLLVL